MAAVAGLLEHDHEVVVTHGNGPQVGNLLVKNELAAGVVPPVPLDWCGAQTQATLGFILMDALDHELTVRGIDRRSAALVTRTLVDADDGGFTTPTKPIGRHLPEAEARVLIGHGETWEDRGEKGWRRVVASPEPLEILDAPAVLALIRGRLRRGRQRRWRDPRRTPRRRFARRRRGRDRQGPRRGPARRDHRGRRARHRHRRAERRHPLRPTRRRAPRPNGCRGDARSRRGRALRVRLDGTQGGRGLPLRRDHAVGAASSPASTRSSHAVAGDAGTVVLPSSQN